MKKGVFLMGLALLFSVVYWGCKKETIDPATYEHVSFSVPTGWPAPYYTFANNTLTTEGFQLGRRLFYDAILSRDTTVSCGSCHQQFASFSHLDHEVSHGIDGLLGTRNTPGLANTAWNTSFFWDGGVNNIENQPINPMQNPVEMDLPVSEAVKRVGSFASYRSQFARVFGDETVNTQRIFRALAQFMGAMVSDDSKYDRYMRNEPGSFFTAEEDRGLQLFRQHCASCHKEPLFSDFSFRNNGLAPNAVGDSGRAHVTGRAEDKYKFKVPSLRNVALSRPYMHDGRIGTLEGVLDHYSSGIYASATTDPLVAGGMSLSEQDKKDIVSFLETLTDSTFINNKLFAEPAQ